MSNFPIPEFPNTQPENTLPGSEPHNAPDTALQHPNPYLLHLQTTQVFALPDQEVVHLGKANPQYPPDLDLSEVPDANIISRVHASIIREAEAFYIQDNGSSNGTFVNHAPLSPEQQYRLVPGDLISLGKEDKVTFVFKL